jgi:hypothetical protein
MARDPCWVSYEAQKFEGQSQLGQSTASEIGARVDMMEAHPAARSAAAVSGVIVVTPGEQVESLALSSRISTDAPPPPSVGFSASARATAPTQQQI